MSKPEKKLVSRVKNYRAVFDTPVGKWVLYDLMKMNNVLGSVVGTTPHETYLKEGERNAVLKIMAVLGVDPRKLEQAIEQGKREEESYD